jgi:glycosyltransferase involved in cell wall biosynthesis
MVEQLARQADGVALLPRPALAIELRRLLAFDVDEHAHRTSVIPEGIHAATIREAKHDVLSSTTAPWPAGVDVLVSAIEALPAHRHGLPLVVSVGRLHPAKGMDRIVQAWATGPLANEANLVVVGGNLDNPSADELDVLATIDDLLEAAGFADGLVLLGRRPHREVARILAAAAVGAPPAIAAGGVYVCGSVKEEFGLAIVEALASGLPVVAPRRGGPATYVDDGVNGVLVDTSSAEAIADGVVAAFAFAGDREALDTSAAAILSRLTIDGMADRLRALYEAVA